MNAYAPRQQQQQQYQQQQQNYMMQHQQQHQQQHHYHQQQQQQFMFNANANVFVPRGHAQQPPAEYGFYNGPPVHQQHYQQQQQHYGAATSAPSSSYNVMYQQQEDTGIDAFAQFGQQSQQYHPSPELSEQINASKCSPYLTEILVGCEQLIAEGEEDSPTWISAIRQRFEDPQMDEVSKKIGVKLIIEMAFTMEPNQFRTADPQNTFSNLLKTLSYEVKDFLRVFIVPTLGEYHEGRKQLENDSRVYMAVFYAEVFVKLTLDNGSRFDKIGAALADQIEEILKFQPKDEYMKCLLRAFKVAGAELDTSEDLKLRADHILTIMGGYAKGSPLLGDSVKAQIFSLIECRTRGWDRAAARGPVRSSAGAGGGGGCVADRGEHDSSFDDSTDNDLTEEERQFLESHLEQVESRRGAEEDYDEQEMMKEFGKFVKEELQQAELKSTSEMLQKLEIEKDTAGAATETDETTPKTEEK
ncbi:Prion-like-(Q/N-rich)-domain-bearing protein [Caenorhabditis elegans]|nr:Prion-like-(Q/N-rich)-domain-bearing protein [Caenorhabditis elegans]CCE72283.1 Prion-like-(Q/N-rich)-domain-bearing protein [Caenorhabditis elegans]|eukprot:NP_001254388.1 Prion-like-(Q/N-rich)-domain-bearing protein [Caenorhabditis elegans]